SALKCTPFKRGTRAVANVVLPAPGKPMMRIFFATNMIVTMPHIAAESCKSHSSRMQTVRRGRFAAPGVVQTEGRADMVGCGDAGLFAYSRRRLRASSALMFSTPG